MVLITNPNDYALDQLLYLVKLEGTLKVTTSIPSRNYNFLGKWHPYAFELHDVVRIEGPDPKGRYSAHTREGDFCLGKPIDLLSRLTEHNRWTMKGKVQKEPGKLYAESLITYVNQGGND
jgi:hypothetical protein